MLQAEEVALADHTVLRRLVLLGTPLALALLEIFHPQPMGVGEAVAQGGWFMWFHIIQVPLIGLMALAVYLLVDGLQGWAAAISRIGAWFFVVFYIALDSIVGIAGVVIARGARGLPADQQASVARQLDVFAFRRAGLSLVPSILIGPSATFAVHSWPTGSLGLAFFLLGAGLAEFASSKRAIQSPV